MTWGAGVIPVDLVLGVAGCAGVPPNWTAGGAYYSLTAVELILSLAGIRPGEHVVCVPHGGKIPGLPGDVVAELTCRVDRDGGSPRPPRLANRDLPAPTGCGAGQDRALNPGVVNPEQATSPASHRRARFRVANG